MVPEADPEKVAEAFARYEKDLTPPEGRLNFARAAEGSNLIRSSIQSKQQSSGNQRQSLPIKKVDKLSDLSGDDKNVEDDIMQ